MSPIGAAIAIAEESAVDESVVVGALAVLDRRCGSDGERQLGQDGWLEDPLRTNQRDSDAFEVEAAFEDGTRNGGFAKALSLLAQEAKARNRTAASRSSVTVHTIADARCSRVSESGTQT